MLEPKKMLLKDLLVTTKDGDWGKGDPEEGYVPFSVIRATDFSDTALGQPGKVPVRYLSEKTVQRRTLEADDILIETAGGSPGRPTGRTMLVTDRVLSAFSLPITCASFARFLRVDKKIVDPRYLYWYLQSLYQSGEIEQYQVQHTGVARFQYTNFAATHHVPVVGMREQRAIAEALGALDDKIASNVKIANTADELVTAMTTRAMDAGQEILLTEIAHVTMGSSPAGSSLNESGDGTVFYQGIRDFGLRYPERRVWTTAPGRMAEEFDTLLSVRAPVGSANIASESICIGRGIASIRSKVGAPYTLFHAIRSSPTWNQYNSEGTVFGSINRKQLESVRLRWVAPQDLQVHESKLTSLEHVIREATATIRTLSATRDALLPQLMSGKLRVTYAEAVVEASV